MPGTSCKSRNNSSWLDYGFGAKFMERLLTIVAC